MPRARTLPKWPRELEWYDPANYVRAVDLAPWEWHYLLLDRRASLAGTRSEAEEGLWSLQEAPLRVSGSHGGGRLPMDDLRFKDLGALELLRTQAEGQGLLEELVPSGITVPGIPEDRSISRAVHDYETELSSFESSLSRRSRFAHLRVDLAVPDKVLEKLFRRWLGVRRARLAAKGLQHGVAPRRSRRNAAYIGPQQLRSWAKLRVLDYLDLQLACRVAQIPVPSAQLLGTKLFGDDRPLRGGADRGVDTTDRFEQQTKPAAAQLMAPGFLEFFHQQLLGEALVD